MDYLFHGAVYFVFLHCFPAVATDNKDEEIRILKRLFLGTYTTYRVCRETSLVVHPPLHLCVHDDPRDT